MALSPALRRSITDAKNKYGNVNNGTLQPKEGRNVYRIIAPTQQDASWVGESGQFWADLGVHWIKAEKGGKPLVVLGSRDICYGEFDPLANAISLAEANAFDEDTKELIKEWRVSKHVLFCAIDRTSNANAENIELLQLRPTAAQQLFDIIAQYDDAGQDICDLENGLDIVVTRSGKGLNTEYTVNVKPGQSAPVPKTAIRNCPDPHAFIAREFFRGEEQKALNVISQITGLTLPAIGNDNAGQAQIAAPAAAAARQSTPALASAGTVADGAIVDATPTPAPAAPAANDELAEAQRKLEEMQREIAEKQTALAAATAASAAPAAPAPAPAEPSPDSELSTSDVEDVMRQLDDL